MSIFSFLDLVGGFYNKVDAETLPLCFLHQMAYEKQHLSHNFDLTPSLLVGRGVITKKSKLEPMMLIFYGHLM